VGSYQLTLLQVDLLGGVRGRQDATCFGFPDSEICNCALCGEHIRPHLSSKAAFVAVVLPAHSCYLKSHFIDVISTF
jgi:hypothetical protein